MSTPTHIFFDLDKTLTVSRAPMDAVHQGLFAALCAKRDVIVVSGGNREQIREQITSRFDGHYYTLAQSGNHALDKQGNELWNEPLTSAQVTSVMTFVDALKRHFDLSVKDENDLVENRGAQISYSVIGFHEDAEEKYAFDPGDSKRQAALRALPNELKTLTAAHVEVVPAGTTTFNFVAAGKDKGHNVSRLLELEGWKKEDCLYLGDALFPGGNDEAVIGVIPTRAVKNPDDTFDFIANALLI